MLEKIVEDSDLSYSEPSRLRKHRILVFSITAALYGSLHASRTAWAYSKPSLAHDTNLSTSQLSILDSSFLSSYAIGLYLSGWLGDRIKLTTLLSRGMLSTVAALSVFVLFFGFMGTPSVMIGIAAFIVSGLGQSSGFPGCIAIMTNWFPSGKKGIIFGAWLVNINLGNIAGQQIGRMTIDVFKLPWYYAIIGSTALMFIITLLMMKFIYVHPNEAHINPRDGQNSLLSRTSSLIFSLNLFSIVWESQNAATISNQPLLVDNPSTYSPISGSDKKDQSIGFLEAFKLPGVFLYSIVYICLKSALYGLLFWLPMYLKVNVGFKDETAGLLACLEAGQLLGVLGLGYISDKLQNRAWLIAGSLFCAVLTFLGINYLGSPEQVSWFRLGLFFGGVFIGGPAGIIVSTVSSELGSHKNNGKIIKATSTITGIIDGSGTIGAAVTQLIMPYFQSGTFIFYTIICLAAAVLTPFAHKHIQSAKQEEIDRELKLDETINTEASSFQI